MIDGLLHLFSPRPWGQVVTDIIDLLLVTWVVYRGLLVLRGTRAMQVGVGLGLVFVVYVVAKWLSFVTLLNLFSTLLSSIILIIVVVFQNDIRRVLMRVGSRAFLGGFGQAQESKVIDEVVAATTELARHRMGAIIAFEQDANLDDFVVGQGISLDAAVTKELLVSLFVPESVNKLHDGAVIIRNRRIEAARCILPVSTNMRLSPHLGLRHRAAVGLTEQTDAFVIIVSEETGRISVAENGVLTSGLTGGELLSRLTQALYSHTPAEEQLEPLES